MTSLDDRKNAFENKFAHDAEFRFKVEARTSKLLGLWAAEQMGVTGDEAATYAGTVVASNLEEAGFADIKKKVRADFDAKGVTVSDHMIESMIEKFFEDAKTQLA
jgi:hypothetical protein